MGGGDVREVSASGWLLFRERARQRVKCRVETEPGDGERERESEGGSGRGESKLVHDIHHTYIHTYIQQCK